MGKFSWDNLAKKVQKDAFAPKFEGYKEDERFYRLSRDKNDNGGALIRFLTDKDGIPFVQMKKIDARNPENNRFCSEWSPMTIGKPDPFNEMFIKLWKEGKKEEAKKFGRKIRYLTNIYVVKDPQNPENNGKFFLFDMSPSLFAKLEAAVKPSEDEVALGAEPKEIFEPVKGHNFLLKIKMGSNKILTFEDSKFDEKITGIFETEAEAEKAIEENTYPLSEFMEESFFKTYEELTETLNWMMGVEPSKEEVKEEPKEVKETPKEVKEEPKDEVDDELEALLSEV
jgi:hypothetical protein